MTSPEVRFPSSAIDDGGSDVLLPLRSLLQGLSVLPSDGDAAGGNASWAVTGTPQSVAILEAGATALSKGWTIAIGALGGATAVGAAVTGFWTAQSDITRIALVGGSAFLLAATVISIAIMVVADVRSRTQGQIELYEVRKVVALEFLKEAVRASLQHDTSKILTTRTTASGTSDTDDTVVRLAAAHARAAVTHVPTGTEGHLSGIRQVDGKVEVQYQRDSDSQVDWCYPSELTVREFSFG